MGARQMIALGTATLGALAALNSALSPAPAPAPQASGTPHHFPWVEGDVFYAESGSGPSVVLVHSIGLTASSFEMRFLAQALSSQFHVYCIDQPGFGRSTRQDRLYAPSLYEALLETFLREVTGPAHVVAAGLSAGYALTVAANQPDLVRSLVLSNAPRLDARSPLRENLLRQADHFLDVPAMGTGVYHALTMRARIRTYLRRQVFANANLVTEAMVDAHYAVAHQPNARFAPQAYLAGHLDADVREVLPAVRQPTLLVLGADHRDAALATAASYVRLQPRIQVQLMDRAAQLPHEEQAEQFATAAAGWFSAIS